MQLKTTFFISTLMVVLFVANTDACLSRHHHSRNYPDIQDPNCQDRQDDGSDISIKRFNETYGEGSVYLVDDMVLTMEQKNALEQVVGPRNGWLGISTKWPNNEVFYEFDNRYQQHEKDTIKLAMSKIEQVSCIKFKPRYDESGYIRFVASGECRSYVGYQGNRQDLNLNTKTCLSPIGIPIHEILHALGFMHMHNTQDRDNYVKINMDNIGYDADDNFRKFSNLDSFGEPYDYESVMHYSQFQFSGNDLATIEAIDPYYNRFMGQRHRLSDIDIRKLNKMYECQQTRKRKFRKFG